MKRLIVAIDPGSEESAVVVLDRNGPKILSHEKMENERMASFLSAMAEGAQHAFDEAPNITLAVEMVACYGMPVGKTVFETCVWIGRFVQAGGGKWMKVYRKDEKILLCGSMKAKDGNIRQALIDKLGPQGTKAAPGPTYGFASDQWAALAVAVTADHALTLADKVADALRAEVDRGQI